MQSVYVPIAEVSVLDRIFFVEFVMENFMHLVYFIPVLEARVLPH